MKKVVIGMLASAAAALFFVSATPACSSSKCSKACSADPEPSEAAVKACEDAKDTSGKGCDSEYSAAQDCSSGKVVCGSDDKTDSAATLKAVTEGCATELKAYADCVAK